jgi:nucleoside-diphosphate-sugar epimerase
MKVLIFGSSSFAAHGLNERLERDGHEVWTFDRSPPKISSQRALAGRYENAAKTVARIGQCDAVVNFAIAKFGSIEENRVLLDHVIDAAMAANAQRFIQISSVSVLPSDRSQVNEASPAVDHPWKGSYSRVKADAESTLSRRWTTSPLLMLRPGFILDDGLVDSIVGIGMPLPTGQILGLGNKRTVIPLVRRDAVHDAIARLIALPLNGAASRNFMLVSPDAPTRQEYLDFHCMELGRGTRTVSVPPFIWKWGLAAASIPLSLLKRKQFRLAKLFQHNIVVRQYDGRETSKALGLDLRFDWRARLCEIYGLGPKLEELKMESTISKLSQAQSVVYFGFGRIVNQKHLGALRRIGFRGKVLVRDPAVSQVKAEGVEVEVAPQSLDGQTHAVISTPWTVRAEILREVPETIQSILFEKPFAVSQEHLSEMNRLTLNRSVYVLHNYRLKQNVSAFRRFKSTYRSGRLRHVTLRFETPSPFIEKSAWIRQEKKHRILVTDYALHFLDVAWMFFEGPMKILQLKVQDNARGELESVVAYVSFEEGDCTLLIRQGGHRREAHVHYAFQNYDAHLRFFPDVFVPTFGDHSTFDDLRLAIRSVSPTVVKIADKLGLTVADRSHDPILAGFLGMSDANLMEEFSAKRLRPFYERLTEFADAAYN